jgi:hypothetical protein
MKFLSDFLRCFTQPPRLGLGGDIIDHGSPEADQMWMRDMSMHQFEEQLAHDLGQSNGRPSPAFMFANIMDFSTADSIARAAIAEHCDMPDAAENYRHNGGYGDLDRNSPSR